jgi:signal transduction histidine kinase
LIETHRSLGSAATLAAVRTGPPRPLPPDAAGAIRRAAQEALSNARRHAPSRQTDLTLTEEPDATTLVAATPLSREPTPASGAGGGRGLAGLRERVTVLGGTAEWGVRDGVFVVTATVPRERS